MMIMIFGIFLYMLILVLTLSILGLTKEKPKK